MSLYPPRFALIWGCRIIGQPQSLAFLTDQAGAVYENKYLLGTSMARPAIAKRLVEIARKEGAAAICHCARSWARWPDPQAPGPHG